MSHFRVEIRAAVTVEAMNQEQAEGFAMEVVATLRAGLGEVARLNNGDREAVTAHATIIK